MLALKKHAVVLFSLWLAASLAHAAGGGGELIVIVADSRGLTGVMAWWASLYNESHLHFARSSMPSMSSSKMAVPGVIPLMGPGGNSTGTVTVGTARAGADPSAFSFGVRHSC